MNKYIKLLLVSFICQYQNDCSFFNIGPDEVKVFKDIGTAMGVVLAIMVPAAYIKDKYWPTPPDPKDLELKKLKAEKEELEKRLKHFENAELLKNEEVSLSEKLNPKKAEDEQGYFLMQRKNDMEPRLNNLILPQARPLSSGWKPLSQIKNIGSLLIKNRINYINQKIEHIQDWEIDNTFNA